MTLKELKQKYKGRYIHFIAHYDYNKKTYDYDVIKAYRSIHENTEKAEDVE